jgi:exocyst complex component 7
MTTTLRGTDRLAAAMEKMESTTSEALRCCDLLTKRARQLDSLTSPASDASAMLSRANANLAATVVLVKDARVHFDTVRDCEPAIDRLQKGVKEMEDTFKSAMGHRGSGGGGNAAAAAAAAASKNQSTATLLLKHRGQYVLTEQDIYAAGDSLEILRDAYRYFTDRQSWQSTAMTLGDLERVYAIGTDAMCRLLSLHLKKSGQSVRPKRLTNAPTTSTTNTNTTSGGKKEMTAAPSDETAHQVRDNNNCLFLFLKHFVFGIFSGRQEIVSSSIMSVFSHTQFS